MATPARTIVYFHYRREENYLVPTSGGLRDAKLAECDYAVDHTWCDELEEGEVRVNIAAEGFAIRPMEAAMEHIGEHSAQWEEQARVALAAKFPECQLVLPNGSEED